MKTELNKNATLQCEHQKRNNLKTPISEALKASLSEREKQMRFWEIVWTLIDIYPFLSENGVVWTEKKTAPFLGAKTDQNENGVMWT